jgi:Ca2+-binding RTX toxin-like protein
MRDPRRKAAVGGLCIAVLCALAVFPAGALAATVFVQNKRIFYTAEPGEVNDLVISAQGSSYRFSDPDATITAGPGCSVSGQEASCSADAINGITVNVGDEADNVENTTPTPSTLSGGDGADSLEGGSGNDTLRGNEGVDTHSGGAGDDFIDSRGDRPDVVSCGIGNDTVRADAADSIAADCETIDRGSPLPAPSPAGSALLGPGETRNLNPGACAQEVLGGTGDDLLNGTALGDSLFGLQGNDILNGLEGDDCLVGGVGSDSLYGGTGSDRLLGDDSRKGVGGADRLFGKAGNDLLVGGSGADRLSGGSGRDRLSGNAGDDFLRGGGGRDRLSGGRGHNRLLGGAGNDRLNGVNGRFDRLNCGRGHDRALADSIDRLRGCERVRRRR